MNKRLLVGILGVFLFASPLLVSAQSSPPAGQSDAFLIAELTQLLHLLEKELQQLLAAQGGTTVAAPTISSFTASPSSITQGQSATLSWNASNATSLSIS